MKDKPLRKLVTNTYTTAKSTTRSHANQKQKKFNWQRRDDIEAHTTYQPYTPYSCSLWTKSKRVYWVWMLVMLVECIVQKRVFIPFNFNVFLFYLFIFTMLRFTNKWFLVPQYNLQSFTSSFNQHFTNIVFF